MGEIFQFGAFELRTETGELFKHGIRIRLQIKPLQILEVLLAKPGQLVTREELCNELWPAGTFVDFESGLNTATNRLRSALNDSADSPRYVETLPRLGYRFICPVLKVAPKETKVEIRASTEVAASAQMETVPPAPRKESRSWLRKLYRATPAVIPAILVALVFAYIQLNAKVRRPSPVFHQLNFRAGSVESARFLAETDSAVYTATSGDSEERTLSVSLDGSNSRTFAAANGVLTAVSEKGDLAMIRSSKLWRVSQQGQQMSELAQGLRCADWLPNGKDLALVRAKGSESQVEFPAGHIIYHSPAYIDNLRVSPNGDELAFLEHPVRDSYQGYPVVVDRLGNARRLTSLWSSADGLAWPPNGSEVWFTAAKTGLGRALYAVSKRGTLRPISNTPSSMRLFDISRSGRILIGLDDTYAYSQHNDLSRLYVVDGWF